MIHWGRTSLLVRSLPPLGCLADCTPPRQATLLEHAAPLFGIPGQHGPAHIHLIPSKTLVPAAIQAVVSFELPNNRFNVCAESLPALEPGRVAVPVTRLPLGRDTHTRHRCRAQALPVMLRRMQAPIASQFGWRLAKALAPACQGSGQRFGGG